ncbi:MAG: hypothetical protein V2I63_05845 [Pseudomonadales bacterium]|jgi:hypothetical protein|nr:hypothetical protein [Pseudomonadales bacterium]
MRLRPAIMGWAVLLMLLTGCTNLGPRSLEAGRADYNIALRDTADEQLLSNLVRLRYRDRPYFLEVASVTTQFKYAPSVSGNFAVEGPRIDDDFGVGVEGLYEETPTIAYTPLQGDAFARRLLTPVSIESLVLLSNSGWSGGRLLRLCVQRLNDVPNAVTASGPTPELAPDFERFSALAAAMRTLQLRDQITFGAIRGEEGIQLALLITNGGEGTAEYREMTTMLGLAPGLRVYRLENALRYGRDDTVNVQTRSLNGVLYFLSHAVEVPPEHIERGWVTRTRTPSGADFDWHAITDDLLTIRASRSRPEHAAVMTRYRDHWFWIADDDLGSKSTFSLLTQLFALQAGSADGATPVLTLPIGG